MTDFYVEPGSWQVDEDTIRSVRQKVFVEEQGFSEQEEFDQHDAKARHFLAYTMDGQPVGNARMLSDGLIGRIAVLQQFRGIGIGDALLRTSIETASTMGLSSVRLGAQLHAIDFYRRHGFELSDQAEYDDGGKPHRWMHRNIDLPESNQRRQHRQTIPLDSGRVEFDSILAYRSSVEDLLKACHRELLIYTQDLDPLALNSEQAYQETLDLASHVPRASIRIIVHDSSNAVRNGHRLINLAHRLPSVIQIRRPHRQHADQHFAYLIADRRHVLMREFADAYQGNLDSENPMSARHWCAQFDEVWQMGSEDPELRRLDL